MSTAGLTILGIAGLFFALIMLTELGPVLALRLSSNQPAAPAESPPRDSASREAERRRAAAEQKAAETWRINSIAHDAKASCGRGSVERAARLVHAHEDWSNQDLIKVACRELWVGMSADQLLAAWGNPQGVNKSSTGFQQWVYGPGTYVYLQGSRVTSWQTYSR